MDQNITKIDILTDDWKKCCRICFSGKSKGRLLSICNCKGSLGLVHKECELKWLQIKNTDKCELCDTKLNVERVNKDFLDWILLKNNTNRMFMSLDVFSALIIIPTLFWSIFTVIFKCLPICQSLVTSILLGISSCLLFLMAIVWVYVCYDHHLNIYYIWSYTQFKYILKENKSQTTSANRNGSESDDNRATAGFWSHLRWPKFWRSYEIRQQINQI